MCIAHCKMKASAFDWSHSVSRRFRFPFGTLTNWLFSRSMKVLVSAFQSFVFNTRPARRGDGRRYKLKFVSCRAANHRRERFRTYGQFRSKVWPTLILFSGVFLFGNPLMQIRSRAFDSIKWQILLSEIILSSTPCTNSSPD